jgi:polar amino acid transport system substrate-binding protein
MSPATEPLVRGLALALSVLLVACGAAERSAEPSPIAATPRASAPPAPTAAASAALDQGCGDPTASLRPQGPLPSPANLPGGSFMKAISERGRLIVGVPGDTPLFGYLNPSSKQIEGFDVDVGKQIARALFGDENRVDLRPMTPALGIPAIQNGTVDLVVGSLSMNCARWKQINFSTVYYSSGQRVLVSKSSTVQGLQDLTDKRVCAPAGTTFLDTVAHAASHPIAVAVTNQSDCLALLQLGQVDAVSVDESVLFGFAAQDLSVKVVGPRLSTEPYGAGVSQAHPEFVRYVNAVLERMRTDGTWTSMYNRWLGRFGPAPAPPPATYRD